MEPQLTLDSLMTKAEFYEASNRRDEELSRRSSRWLYWLLAAVFIPLLAGFLFLPSNKEPAPERAWFIAGYMFVVLCVYLPVTRRLHDSINHRHGMKCLQCMNIFESNELTHLGFKNVCKKCGKAPFQTQKDSE